ncbi:arginine deiminase [uncultured Enorma sp.]|uniref:arginine deiminase n=1 Tax=uncultured Enorma sp. TaxID=1714346 RepID=UPI0025925CD9|nr:arginine deiminase [uncultured Enorma sp.]
MYEGLNVHTEIGPLKKVMLHRPGLDMLYFGDEDFDRVWFHDALYIEVAQKEHDAFANLLRSEGAEVLYLEDLLREALDADPDARRVFTDAYLAESRLAGTEYIAAAREFLDAIPDTSAFVERVFRGIRRREIDLPKASAQTLVEMAEAGGDADSLIDPLPSSYFTRDAFAIVGNGVNMSRMYHYNRNRETLLGDTIFTYHPEYKDVPRWYDRKSAFHTEGGDVLNFSRHTLAIGLSERTEAAAIDQMAQNMFWGSEECEIKEILAFKIPKSYAFMHLDTVFTQIDVDTFTVHPNILGNLVVYRLTPGAKPGEVHIEEIDDTLEHILEKALGLDAVKLIECGGGDPVLAAREQWNDGSNTLCVKPGVVCVYDRNVVTNDLLYKNGIKLLTVPSAELSRGRGGPRCMSMPFWREEL